MLPQVLCVVFAVALAGAAVGQECCSPPQLECALGSALWFLSPVIDPVCISADMFVLALNGSLLQEYNYFYFDYTNKMARFDIYASLNDKRIKETVLERWDLVC